MFSAAVTTLEVLHHFCKQCCKQLVLIQGGEISGFISSVMFRETLLGGEEEEEDDRRKLK